MDRQIALADKKVGTRVKFISFVGREEDVNGSVVYSDGEPLHGASHVKKTVVVRGAQFHYSADMDRASVAVA